MSKSSKIQEHLYTKLETLDNDFDKINIMRLNMMLNFNEAINNQQSESACGFIVERFVKEYVSKSDFCNYSGEISKLFEGINRNNEWKTKNDNIDGFISSNCKTQYEDYARNENHNFQEIITSTYQLAKNQKITQNLLNEAQNGNHLPREKTNQHDSLETKEFFRSAEEELYIQKMKKNEKTSTSTSTEPLFNYGITKKSLGGKRFGLNNFVPPFKPNLDDIELEAKNKEHNDTPLTDNRLKNVDEKMIEVIKNEIMHKIKPIDWSHIAGLEYAKSIIKEAVVWPLLRPEIFTGIRKPPRGILLFGPPGTGKTLIGKCIASQSQSTFFSISASSLTSKWVGDGEKMVRALFAVAAVYQPSIVFIDEIDSLLCQRSETENECSRRIKTEFLIQLDGAATSEDERILIVGATNRPQELDEAARRRLVRRLYIPLPDAQARLKILSNLMLSVKNELTYDAMIDISKLTEGYSGADIEVLCKEASMEPIRSIPSDKISYFREDEVRAITIEDFQVALTRVRSSVSQNDIKQYVEWNKTYGSGDIF